MKKTENNFVFLCNKLEKESCSICMVRKAVKEYVGADYDKFLQLKAEAEDGGYYEHVNTLLAGGAFIISVLSIVCNCIIDTASKMEARRNRYKNRFRFTSTFTCLLSTSTVCFYYAHH